MVHSSNTRAKAWTKPELARLGKLADVAATPLPGPQGSNTKT